MMISYFQVKIDVVGQKLGDTIDLVRIFVDVQPRESCEAANRKLSTSQSAWIFIIFLNHC